MYYSRSTFSSVLEGLDFFRGANCSSADILRTRVDFGISTPCAGFSLNSSHFLLATVAAGNKLVVGTVDIVDNEAVVGAVDIVKLMQ